MPKTATDREYITADEIAALLNIHPTSITRWVNDGWFPAPMRLGPAGRWRRWRRTVVEKFLREKEAANANGGEAHAE